MELIPLKRGQAPMIDGYGQGRFRVGGQDHPGSIIAVGEHVFPWPVRQFADLSVESFEPLSELEQLPEIVLLGCGPAMGLIKSAMKAALKDRGLVVDPMPTAAACRTYNLMLGEDRRVAACLIAV